MTRMKVKEIPNGSVSDDGMEVSVNVILEDGKNHVLVLPFAQFDWFSQALMKLAEGAFTRQVQSGRLSAANPVDAAMTVQGFRVLARAKQQDALVQLTGRKDANGPSGILSFSIGAAHIEQLSGRLHEVADQLRQQGKPNYRSRCQYPDQSRLGGCAAAAAATSLNSVPLSSRLLSSRHAISRA